MLIVSCQNWFLFACGKNLFSYERMNTRTRFQKEAKGNSEMAYLKKQIYMRMRQSGNNVKDCKLFLVGAYLSMKQGLILFQLLEGSDKEKMAHRSTQVVYTF